jgi:drug/metabolite transporter (DMT)-like permease
LYRINLLPGLLAAIMIGYAIYTPGTFFGSWGWQSIGTTVLIITGTLCEGVYFVLYKKEEYTHKKYLWVYSIIVNSLFIASYLATLVTGKFSPIVLLVAYPGYFLYKSCMALKNINSFTTVTAAAGHQA